MTRDEVIGGISALRRLSCECVYVRTYGEEEKHIRVSAHCVGQGTLRSEQVLNGKLDYCVIKEIDIDRSII